MIINVKIDVKKIDKEKHLYKGKKGTYLNVVVAEMKEQDSYGNTHTVYVQQTEDERKANAPKVYLGNGRAVSFNNTPKQQNTQNSFTPPESVDDLPF